VHDAPDVGAVRIQRGVHRDDGALDGRELALSQGPVQSDPDHAGGRQSAQRWRGGEVHLIRIGHANAHVAVSVGGDRPAGDHLRGGIDDLVDEGLIHVAAPFVTGLVGPPSLSHPAWRVGKDGKVTGGNTIRVRPMTKVP